MDTPDLLRDEHLTLMEERFFTRQDQFAELLAIGHTMLEIRAIMGLTNGAAQGMMSRLRAKMGWQAV